LFFSSQHGAKKKVELQTSKWLQRTPKVPKKRELLHATAQATTYQDPDTLQKTDVDQVMRMQAWELRRIHDFADGDQPMLNETYQDGTHMNKTSVEFAIHQHRRSRRCGLGSSMNLLFFSSLHGVEKDVELQIPKDSKGLQRLQRTADSSTPQHKPPRTEIRAPYSKAVPSQSNRDLLVTELLSQWLC